MFTILLVFLARLCQKLTGLRHPTPTQPLRAPGICTAHFTDSEQENPSDSSVQYVYFIEMTTEALLGVGLAHSHENRTENLDTLNPCVGVQHGVVSHQSLGLCIVLGPLLSGMEPRDCNFCLLGMFELQLLHFLCTPPFLSPPHTSWRG